MASHEELINELPKLDKLSNAARLKTAKKHRLRQLKKYQEWVRQERASTGGATFMKKRNAVRVVLEDGAMLSDMVGRNDIIGVKKLLDRGVDPNTSNADGLTPLHKCCIDNTVELAQVLLEYGADLNARDVEGWTPLHAASATGNVLMINILLEEGASLVAINHDDKMPVDVAADGDIRYILQQKMLEAGYTDDVLEYIRVSVPKTMLADLKDSVKQNRSLNLQDKYGTSALHVAAANGYMEVLRFMFAQDSLQLDIQDTEGWTPFHAAVCWGQQDAMKALAERGANMDIKNLHGETAYTIAEEPEIRQYILDLKSQFGKAEDVNIEEEMPLDSLPRTRRFSVRRMKQAEKDNMWKDNIKEEATMRRASMAMQDQQRDQHNDDMNMAESVTLLSVTKLNPDHDDPVHSPISSTEGSRSSTPNPCTADKRQLMKEERGGGKEEAEVRETVNQASNGRSEEAAQVRANKEKEGEGEVRKKGVQKAISDSSMKSFKIDDDDKLEPRRKPRDRKSLLKNREPTPVLSGPTYTSTSGCSDPEDCRQNHNHQSNGKLRECCSLM